VQTEAAYLQFVHEERRLMHVAITRGRERVYIIYVSGHEDKDGRWIKDLRSHFLKSIDGIAKVIRLPSS
jgi:superfamily I DNA/RNA helicase